MFESYYKTLDKFKYLLFRPYSLLLLVVFIFGYSNLAIVCAQAPTTIDALQEKASNTTGIDQIEVQNQLARAFLESEQYIDAAKIASETIVLAKKMDHSVGLATAYDMEGFAFQAHYDYPNAAKCFQRALDLRKKLEDAAGIATSKNNIGKILFLQGEIEAGIEHYEIALETRERINDVKGAAETHENLGDAYLYKKQYGDSKNHYKRALDLQVSQEAFLHAASIASQLGKIASTLGDYDSALVYYMTSKDLNSASENLLNLAKDYNNIALVHLAQRSYREAKEANQAALDIRQDIGDKLGLAESYLNAARLYAEKGQRRKARKKLETSADFLTSINGKPGVHELYKAIASMYEQLGDYKNAYAFHILHSTNKEIAFSKEKKESIYKLMSWHKSDSTFMAKQYEIDRLEMLTTTQQSQNLFLILMVALAGTLAVTLFFGYRRKRKDNTLLRTKNQEIRLQKEEIYKKNEELNSKNESLDILNNKLLKEIGERESIEKSSFARDHFLATMSHEMRTPINAIIGLTHLLLDEDPRRDQVEHLRTLQFSANNLTVFINDVLDFSKIEVGKLTLETRAFQPKQLFDGIYERFKKPVEDKGLSLYYDFDKSIPQKLLGDPARLNQIVNNLLSSSLQHTTKGSVKLQVRLDRSTAEHPLLQLQIVDTGSGLKSDSIEKMFRKFTGNFADVFDGYDRSEAALAIAKRLIDLQNGKIEVDSKNGQGTIFKLYIPCKLETELAQPQQPQQMQVEDLEGRRILVVEDNKINQLVVSKILRKLGVEIVAADNGKEAITAVQKMDFDLILMDIQMPIMDGYKATNEIRNMADPNKSNIPIIALTASAFLSETEKAKLFGMNDHVGKPFGPEDLLEKIAICLAEKPATRAS